MATESDLRELLDAIGDRAPTVEHALARLELPEPAPAVHRRWLPVAAASAAVAAVAVSVLVTVAVRGNDQQVGGAGMGPGPTVDHATYRLPLDAYYASASQMQTLQRAQFVLAQRCARAHGVALPTVRFAAPDPQVDFVNQVANDVRPLTLAQARTIGYDSPRGTPSALDAALATLTPHQLEIVQGRTAQQILAEPTGAFLHDGGCLGQAERTLLTGATPVAVHDPSGVIIGRTYPWQPGLFDDDNTMDLFVNAARYGETTPAVRQAQRRWSSCMAVHHYPGLHATTDAIGKGPDLQSASAKRRAVQDVRCKESTGFMTVWVAAMTRAQNAVIAAHREQLAGFRARLGTRMANAAKALK